MTKNATYCDKHVSSWKCIFFVVRINTTITVSHSKGLTWHFIETKAIKHDYYRSIIMWTHKNSKDKYWVVSQQALFFNAFLARHDDDNDAHVKDKN